MKTAKTLLILLFFTQIGCAQKEGWRMISVNTTDKYEIINEGKIEERRFFNEQNDTIRASLIVDDNSSIQIRFTNAASAGDSLKILIYEDNEAFSHKYLITVVNGKYFIKYNLLIDISEDEDGEILPYETKLILNTLEFKKGDEIRGYTEFKGRWKNNLNEDTTFVRGNFKIIIQ